MHSGATRNVYVGNIEDFELFGEEKLKRDFGEYGDIELVNFLKEKYAPVTWLTTQRLTILVCRNCAFVNFTNISNAIKAIDGVKNKPDYANLRIAHGKDRCANPPRSGPQGGSRRSASGNTANGVGTGMNEIGEGVEEDFVGVVDGIGEENGVAGPGPEIPEMRIEAEHEAINGAN